MLNKEHVTKCAMKISSKMRCAEYNMRQSMDATGTCGDNEEALKLHGVMKSISQPFAMMTTVKKNEAARHGRAINVQECDWKFLTSR